jgi:hypothetical protein
MASDSLWSEEKEKDLVVRDSRVVWYPDSQTKVHSIYAGTNGSLRRVFFGTDPAFIENGWTSGGIIGPQVPLTVEVVNAYIVIVYYRELLDPPFGKVPA